ncbi:23S rRNA (uracil(1939)-C(5))-methyltransferase RlmD [Zobellella aerophila]|uniref:23S rRNA (uracil(1939)-C(5))-methyltransferase RlmD n=1 Tax=Zobellella aerophila TaxID=870480 RepID=A0ABP6VY38_9GAMM
MVQFFKVRKPDPKALGVLDIDILELNGHGVGLARYRGKPLFVPGTLPGEKVRVRLTGQHSKYHKGQLLKVLQPSPRRTKPFCSYIDSCGGCSLQHLPPELQHQSKELSLNLLFSRLLPAPLPLDGWLTGPERGYRRVARLAIRRQGKGVALGFRRAQSHELVEIDHCGVLHPELSALIVPLRQLLNRLKGSRQLGHLELYHCAQGIALLLRHTDAFSDRDLDTLLSFAQQHALTLVLQDDKDRRPLHVSFPPYYQLDGFKLAFTPGDFIQVNPVANEAMVTQAIDWLAATPEQRVLDLFCGVGNFSLPLAARVKSVVGVEGVQEMVEQARGNAEEHGCHNVRFYRADLASDFTREPWAQEGFDAVLLDPGRAGAERVMPYLVGMAPGRLVYVSCNPATLARDAEVLLAGGYRLTRMGLTDMFPHTAHSEVMALFELT